MPAQPTPTEGNLQNLRDFTVQIRSADQQKIVGTGVVVSMDGQVVTCAHVVQAVTGQHPRDANGLEVGVYFPQVRGQERKAYRATVEGCFDRCDDDVALLRLDTGQTPLGPEQVSVLGTAEGSEGNRFRSYGYAPVGPRPAKYVDGEVMGAVEEAMGYEDCFHEEPYELRTQDIRPGISGGAVLDEDRNLVIGIISERWNPHRQPEDMDFDNVGYAVNARVLSLDPLNIPVRGTALPLSPAPQPRTDIAAARRAVNPVDPLALRNAPAPIPEWVGRADLLSAISQDWTTPTRRVTGLIGFGGEGKTTLARQWLHNLLDDPALPRPDGIFWWAFYDRPNVDEFFEAALEYMIGGRIDPQQTLSANVRAQIIGAMLGSGRYLFVLDGLEIIQINEGDDFGLFKSGDMAEFLALFAAPGHESFCLVTSRAPLLDLLSAPAYTHRDVTRLSATDGRDLLRRVGVTGEDAALDRVVQEWDGHALTLGLLGSYLRDAHGGDLAHYADIPQPTANEPRYERVHRILRRYDDHLTEAERAFLTLFSAFRTPVQPGAFGGVFRTTTGGMTLNAPLAALNDAAFDALVARLVTLRILRHDEADNAYTAHPLVRNHYFTRLTQGADAASAHEQIKDYYLANAGDVPRFPTLDDLAPLIEVVYHACRAGAYDEAFRIRWNRIDQGDRFVLIHQLGAYETQLALMREFFPGGDMTRLPGVSDPKHQSWILSAVGLCLMSLGRLAEAVPFWERKIPMNLEMEAWNAASIGYQNLAELHIGLGALGAGADAAAEALTLARRAANKQDECFSLAYAAWAAHLRGDTAAAADAFRQAEALEKEIDPNEQYLYSNRGIQHAEHLRRTGQADYARRVTEANLAGCVKNYKWPKDESHCHRVLGDLEADAGDLPAALGHYDQALQIARGIQVRDVLIEALLARGRFVARHRRDAASARADLVEALALATDGGYRRYEADLRVALGWLHLAADLPAEARREAARARSMSTELGYHWGVVDADEVLAAL
jgi:tetratricopeptide (TPR) repeat protein